VIHIALNNVSKRFDGPSGEKIEALVGISMSFKKGDMVIVVGPNGSGKSTLLGVLAGTLQPDNGDRLIDHNLNTNEKYPTTQSGIVYLGQDPDSGTVSDFSVEENLRLMRLPRYPRFWRRALNLSDRAEVTKAYKGTALRDVKPTRPARDISYGQRQILALEMAAQRKVGLMLLDEPTASLDRTNAALCMYRASELTAELEAISVVVTHDIGIAASFGNRLLIMKDGRISYEFSTEEKKKLTATDIFELCEYQRSNTLLGP
jgi:putative tryptophan/tyrosine transport system ATP-binding protein